MQYLKVTNLTKTYISKPIIDHVSFVIEKWQKVALVARNWAGKSTLLNLIVGKIDLSDWEIEFNKNIKFWFLSQNLDQEVDSTVLDCLFSTDHTSAQIIKKYEQMILDPETNPDDLNEIIIQMEEHKAREYESKINIIISKLNLTDLLTQKLGTISWWEAKRVALAKTLVDEPDFLILDEPTNHLDLQMIEWLENYFEQQSITLFMITHDRYFLERVCTDIFELDRWKIFRYPGSYSYFLEKKAIRQENEKIEVHKLKQLFTKELAWIHKSPRARSTKQQFRQDRFSEIEKSYDTKKDMVHQDGIKLEISMEERKMWSKILKIKNLNKSFWDKKIVEHFNHEFRHQERIGIIGKNWIGKSTFLDILMGIQNPDSGLIEPGEKVEFGYYQQKEIIIPPNKRVIDYIRDASEFMRVGNGEKISASHLLERFLFPQPQHFVMAETLSWWEKRRLYLLTVLMKNPNFLILDEPTNDLDLITLGILEDFLLQFQGCLIVVSHDRYFMDKIVDHIFTFEWNGIIKDFWWTYSEYSQNWKIEKLKHGKMKVNDNKKNESESDSEQESDIKRKLSSTEKQELNQIMRDIKKLEERKETINKMFNDITLPYDDIGRISLELAEVIKKIEQKEYRWFELMTLLWA